MEGLPEPGPVGPLPDRVVGYADVRLFLRSVGISVTLRTLRSNVAEFGGPEGDLRRSQAIFDSDDLKAWVRFLTGYRYEQWVKRWERSDKKHPFVYRRPKVPVKAAEERTLFVLTALVAGSEEILRLPDGTVFVTHSRDTMKAWPAEVRDRAHSIATFGKSRATRKSDFDATATASVSELVAPRLMLEGELRYVDVVGSLFRADRGSKTPLVAPPSWGGWPRQREIVERSFPAAIWTTWSARSDLHRFLFMPVLPRAAGHP